jgi:OOP family OmpA-OmpF porin
MKKLIIALLATMTAAGAAQAQTAEKAPGAYIGFGIASVDKLVRNGDTFKTKWFGGYEFDKNFGIEIGTINLGRESLTYSSGGQSIDQTVRGRASYVAGKYTHPINEQLSAYGKLGMSYTVVKHTTNMNTSFRDSNTGVYAGLGMQYKVTPRVALTAEYERFGKKDYGRQSDAWTLGAKYNF